VHCVIVTASLHCPLAVCGTLGSNAVTSKLTYSYQSRRFGDLISMYLGDRHFGLCIPAPEDIVLQLVELRHIYRRAVLKLTVEKYFG
jgi:hypothetical protein